MTRARVYEKVVVVNFENNGSLLCLKRHSGTSAQTFH